MTLPLTGPSLPPKSGIRKPKQVVILLHGLGADGEDLIGLGSHFAGALPDAEFLSPHAPFPCDMAPFGRQWFSLQDRNPARILAGLAAVRPVLDRYLDIVLESRGLGAADLALVGFSQGTMLSLHGGLRRPAPLAAIVGFSGRFLHESRLDGEIVARPPVLLVHGEEDPTVEFSSMAEAVRSLTDLRVPVETLARPGLGHWIDDEGVARGTGFLVRGFTEKQA